MKISDINKHNEFLTKEMPCLCEAYQLYYTFQEYGIASCIFVKKQHMDKIFVNGCESNGNYFGEDVNWDPLDYIYCCETIEDIKNLFEILGWWRDK